MPSSGPILSAELALALACIRFPHDDAAVSAAVAKVADWAEFERLVRTHRIAGLVQRALSASEAGVPADIRAQIATTAQAAMLTDLKLARETLRLQRRLDDARIPALFVKGAALGVLAYGAIGVKQSWDIDLLTSQDALFAVKDVLEADGYTLVEPVGLSSRALARFADLHHEAQFRNAQGLVVELHWRLSGNRHQLSGIGVDSPAQMVEIAGQPVRTLGNAALIPYLIAHGQHHGWSRIKWLADLNALLERLDDAGLEALVRESDALGIGETALAALLLCEQLMGLRLPKGVAARARADRRVIGMRDASLMCIAYPQGGSEIPLLSRANRALVMSELRAAGGRRRLLSELGALWTQPEMRARYPRYLGAGYHLLRIPLFIVLLPVKFGDWWRRPGIK